MKDCTILIDADQRIFHVRVYKNGFIFDSNMLFNQSTFNINCKVDIYNLTSGLVAFELLSLNIKTKKLVLEI